MCVMLFVTENKAHGPNFHQMSYVQKMSKGSLKATVPPEVCINLLILNTNICKCLLAKVPMVHAIIADCTCR